jgi:hypothetical protein
MLAVDRNSRPPRAAPRPGPPPINPLEPTRIGDTGTTVRGILRLMAGATAADDNVEQQQEGGKLENTMTTEQKIIRAKVGLLELAKQLGNVSQACKMMGSAATASTASRSFTTKAASWRCQC